MANLQWPICNSLPPLAVFSGPNGPCAAAGELTARSLESFQCDRYDAPRNAMNFFSMTAIPS